MSSINKYYFQHRNLLIAIHAKDLEDAFIPWKRFTGGFSKSQSEFEKVLIEPEDTSDHCILIGNGLNREETLRIINTKKSSKYTDAPKHIAKAIKESVQITEKEYEQISAKYVQESIDAVSNHEVLSVSSLKDCPLAKAIDKEGFELMKTIVENSPVIKRGRGRPPGSKNKTTSIQNYFVE